MIGDSLQTDSPKKWNAVDDDKGGLPRAKALFIARLKAFLRQEKGDYIFDQLHLCASNEDMMLSRS